MVGDFSWLSEIVGNWWWMASCKAVSVFFFFIAYNAWLFSVICNTISLSSLWWGKKKGDLLARQPHAMLRRLNSLKGIYPLLLLLILCGLQVSERSPITSVSYKRDSWSLISFPFTDLKIYYMSEWWMTGRSWYATQNHLPESDLKAFSFELNSNLSLSQMQTRNLQLLK